ncbi:hypothetical protein FEM48_Zijuj11G0002400 [Ziziphus jujuba var. spinosa]|uniref:RRM domain-containing protein n=1 Tax=Ziziphus jujuba var. spinosa TaxID=714518 RepID=A0A978UFQ9_ZIZJJ|nr:hypothetical protein FEM48_Zijuj11G0002400 [Ziziphus jujuba var. spinosa]
MAVVENAGLELGKSVGLASSNRSLEVPSLEASGHAANDQDQPKHGQLRNHVDPSLNQNSNAPVMRPHDQSLHMKIGATQARQVGLVHHQQRSNGGGDLQRNGDHHLTESFKRDMRELRELFSKLNPMAEEFVPPSLANSFGLNAGFYTNNMLYHEDNNNNNNNRNGNINGHNGRRRNNQGKRRMNSRTSLAQREDRIRKTVYVSDIDQQVTEEQLAALFVTCGQVVDCRICGDPNSVLRFAFVEFTDEEGAQAALSLAGTMLGFYPVRVLPSKTAIAPVNPTFLPRVSQAEVKLFFESVCGEVYRLRLLGDYHHSTRIAFVEFVMAESAIAALNCSGVVLGSLPIRISPSKTPVRPRAPRLSMHRILC